jgi:hypothetical protein
MDVNVRDDLSRRNSYVIWTGAMHVLTQHEESDSWTMFPCSQR